MARRLDSALGQESDSQGRAAGLAPRLALLVVTVVFAGFAVNAFQYVVVQGATFARVVPAGACLALMMVLQLGFFSRPGADVRGPLGYSALFVQALLTFVPMFFFHEAWTGMPGFLAGDALLVLRLGTGWVAFFAIAAVAGVIQSNLTGPGLEVVYIANLTMVIGLVVYGLSRLRSLVRELEDARSELAGLAVARERLRFARDLHDLLGFSLSAVTLKTELTHRLVPLQPKRAKQELDEILEVSRQALADVRAVASSYRELSLDDELASARSVLSAAEVVVDVHAGQGDVPPRVRTVLATVLREGVTNLLRHSKAENCSITVSRDDGAVCIEIVNDGVRDDVESEGHGNGISNLTQRVRALGGTLTARADDDTYRLHASIPLSGQENSPTTSEPHTEHGAVMAPRLGSLIATAVFTGYAISSIILTFAWLPDTTSRAVAIACILASLGLMLGFFSRPSASVRSPLGYALLCAQAVLTYLPMALFEHPLLGMPGYLAGASLLVLPARFGVPVFLLVMASAGGAHWLFEGSSINIVFGFIVTSNHGLVVFGLSRLRSMVQDLHDARTELAHLAVTKERLRFARDLHDLLGYSLSAITLKSELTHRLVERDPERAQQELSGILDISRQALADVRAVASSYREMSLDEETVSARALLAAANINVTLRFEPCELSSDVRTTLATVLREGVTNLLRHSKAANCEITLARSEDRLTMEIVNDGLLAVPPPSTNGGGSGIHNLTARVTNIGGTLVAGTTPDNTYRLQAEIPLH
ncbi:sensor histidine kinase [Lentzea tibetensis]|uniref:sensor histidine kinase n=1 Tax=Lentzea tibetensis TaxID=2591470 RepID=UPI00164534A4|nr:histidine kinase [Lentzea tibetensis]